MLYLLLLIFNVDCIEFMKTKLDKCYDLVSGCPYYGINLLKTSRVKDRFHGKSRLGQKGIPIKSFGTTFR